MDPSPKGGGGQDYMIPPPEYFSHLYEYVKWADLRQYETTKPLSDEEYFKDRGWSFGSIHKVMLHELAAQAGWRDRFVGQQVVWLADEPRMAPRESLEPVWNTVHERFTSFLQDQTPQSLTRDVKIKNMKGEEYAIPQWKLLVHVCNHAATHRGQLNSMIKLAGGTPAATDYTKYVLESSK
jgi:uncharacterized damage-inducible protein DinB